jgi:hypothetical protein
VERIAALCYPFTQAIKEGELGEKLHGRGVHPTDSAPLHSMVDAWRRNKSNVQWSLAPRRCISILSAPSRSCSDQWFGSAPECLAMVDTGGGATDRAKGASTVRELPPPVRHARPGAGLHWLLAAARLRKPPVRAAAREDVHGAAHGVLCWEKNIGPVESEIFEISRLPAGSEIFPLLSEIFIFLKFCHPNKRQSPPNTLTLIHV